MIPHNKKAEAINGGDLCIMNQRSLSHQIFVFRIFCQMGTDIYILTYFWNLTKDYVEYVYRNYYVPEYNQVGTSV